MENSVTSIAKNLSALFSFDRSANSSTSSSGLQDQKDGKSSGNSRHKGKFSELESFLAQGGDLRFRVIDAIFAKKSGKQLESFDIKVKMREIVGKLMALAVFERKTSKVVGTVSVGLDSISLHDGLDGWFEVRDGRKWLGQIHLKLNYDNTAVPKESKRKSRKV